MAGVKYDAHYRVTSVDPPELVRFIRQHHPDVDFEIPRDNSGKPITMWNLIAKNKYPPTRLARYCCRALKEPGGDGRMMVTGVRKAESNNRAANQGLVTIHGKKRTPKYMSNVFGNDENFSQTKKGGFILINDNDESRQVIEQCYVRMKTSLNPIIDWQDEDVWAFIHINNIPYCSLYDEGFERIGCIGCPMAKKQRIKQFERYPKYKDAYLRAFGKIITEREAAGMSPMFPDLGRPASPEDIYEWWVST